MAGSADAFRGRKCFAMPGALSTLRASLHGAPVSVRLAGSFAGTPAGASGFGAFMMSTVFAQSETRARATGTSSMRPARRWAASRTQLAMRLRGKHKADLHAARRHRRSHRRDQRREDPRHGQQARRQDLLPAHRRHRQHQDRSRSASCSRSTRARHRIRREGHAAEEPARPQDVQEAAVFAGDKHPHAAQQPKQLEI